MAATSKIELLTVTVHEFSKLEKLVHAIDEVVALDQDDEETSIKDIVAHRAHWIGLFLGWYHDGLGGKKVYFPAEGYKWNDLKRYNADLRQAQSLVGWAEACSMLADAHGSLIEFITEHSDEELYGGPMVGANNKWTPGRWAEAAGPSHYRSAAKALRARQRALTS